MYATARHIAVIIIYITCLTMCTLSHCHLPQLTLTCMHPPCGCQKQDWSYFVYAYSALSLSLYIHVFMYVCVCAYHWSVGVCALCRHWLRLRESLSTVFSLILYNVHWSSSWRTDHWYCRRHFGRRRIQRVDCSLQERGYSKHLKRRSETWLVEIKSYWKSTNSVSSFATILTH